MCCVKTKILLKEEKLLPFPIPGETCDKCSHQGSSGIHEINFLCSRVCLHHKRTSWWPTLCICTQSVHHPKQMVNDLKSQRQKMRRSSFQKNSEMKFRLSIYCYSAALIVTYWEKVQPRQSLLLSVQKDRRDKNIIVSYSQAHKCVSTK